MVVTARLSRSGLAVGASLFTVPDIACDVSRTSDFSRVPRCHCEFSNVQSLDRLMSHVRQDLEKQGRNWRCTLHRQSPRHTQEVSLVDFELCCAYFTPIVKSVRYSNNNVGNDGSRPDLDVARGQATASSIPVTWGRRCGYASKRQRAQRISRFATSEAGKIHGSTQDPLNCGHASVESA